MSDGNTPPGNPPWGNAQPQPPMAPSPYGYGQPGGYGAAPPPPPPYGAPGGFHQPYSPGEAMSYGWTKFKAHAGVMIAMTLIMIAAYFAVEFLLSLLLSALGLGGEALTDALGNTNPESSKALSAGFGIAQFGSSLLFAGVARLATAIFLGALYKGALLITDGRTPSIGDMFTGWNKVTLVVATLLVTVFTYLGLIALIVGALIVAFLLVFTPYFVVDRQDISAMDAISASFNLVKNNVGDVLLFALLAFGVLLIGFCACCIGLIVAMPVVAIGAAFTFRRLQGQPVAP